MQLKQVGKMRWEPTCNHDSAGRVLIIRVQRLVVHNIGQHGHSKDCSATKLLSPSFTMIEHLEYLEHLPTLTYEYLECRDQGS